MARLKSNNGKTIKEKMLSSKISKPKKKLHPKAKDETMKKVKGKSVKGTLEASQEKAFENEFFSSEEDTESEEEERGNENKDERGNENGKKVTLLSRSSLKSFVNIAKKLNDGQKRVVEEMGFGSLLKWNCASLNRKFATWLVDRFDLSKRSLCVHGKELKITTGHVQRILGLDLTGDDVLLHGHDEDVKSVRDQNLFEFNSDNKVKLKTVESYLMKTDDSGLNFKMNFGIYIMNRILCPTSSTTANMKFLHALVHEGKLNWSKYVLEFLIEGIADYKAKKTDDDKDKTLHCKGCVMFLLLFYCHYFTLHPKDDGARPSYDEPAICYLDSNYLSRKISAIKKKGYTDEGKGIEMVFERQEHVKDANVKENS